MSDFYDQVKRFNEIYKLAGNDQPTLLGPERIKNFMAILNEEVDEGEDIFQKLSLAQSHEAKIDVLTDMSDWLGDMIVYCASEARRWGIPLPEVLSIIMESNFSKLDQDGQPIYDERGKVMKGPHYWKPEPRIREIIEERLADLEASQAGESEVLGG